MPTVSVLWAFYSINVAIFRHNNADIATVAAILNLQNPNLSWKRIFFQAYIIIIIIILLSH